MSDPGDIEAAYEEGIGIQNGSRNMKGRRLTVLALLCLVFSMLCGIPPAGGEEISNEACLECHGDPELNVTREGRTLSLYVDLKVYAGSMHADAACTDCHADIEEVPHEERLQPVDCSACHDAETEDYGQSIHGLRLAGGDMDAPGCEACHGKHGIRNVKDPQARVSRVHLVRVCIGCHVDEAVTDRHQAHMPKPETIKAYAASIHGRGVFKKGLSVSAVCVDCHGTHTIEPADDPRSPVHRSNISGLCGRCHPDIAKVYGESIHGRALAEGIRESPVCTDCHGEHTIAAPSDPTSSVASRNVPKTCAACHEEEGISGKYGIPGRRYATYLDSFHGVVNRYGEAAVANCASCHGVHDIRPSSDPASSIHPSNLGKTCGVCHPGAEAGLAGAKVHVEATPESSKGMYYVRMFYIYFIGGLMACFLIYMSIDIYGSLRRRRRR